MTREEIGKLFVKWNLPTHQVVISEILATSGNESRSFAAEELERLNDDSWHYFRTCHNCGNSWYSLHCPHDGAQGKCSECGTRLDSFPDHECKCEFVTGSSVIDARIRELRENGRMDA